MVAQDLNKWFNLFKQDWSNLFKQDLNPHSMSYQFALVSLFIELCIKSFEKKDLNV